MYMNKKPLLLKSPSMFLSKIIDAYPQSDSLTLRKVIGLGKVIYEENETLGGMPTTAAVLNTKPYTLVFGKNFIEKNMQTIEDCVYLLSHELTHLVLDHFAKDIYKVFEDKKLAQKAMHIIVDCQVNATCYNSLLDDKYFEFIKRFYPKEEMPCCFFRHDGIPPTKELQDLHNKLYSVDGITNEELIDGLMPWFEQEQDKLDQALEKLLGNHKDLLNSRINNESLEDLIDAVTSDTLDMIKRNKEKLKDIENDNKSKEAGKGNTIREEYVNQNKNWLK